MAGGRPPKYESKEQIEGLIEAYFKKCEGEILKDDDGEVVFDKSGHPVMIGARPPTVTGLALALGFNTRTSLLNYQGKKEFLDTIRAQNQWSRPTQKNGCLTVMAATGHVSA